jgi:NADPH-dependent 2,4-dienoyl-CoA reductase/sulfur reductase-like enzyme
LNVSCQNYHIFWNTIVKPFPNAQRVRKKFRLEKKSKHLRKNEMTDIYDLLVIGAGAAGGAAAHTAAARGARVAQIERDKIG